MIIFKTINICKLNKKKYAFILNYNSNIESIKIWNLTFYESLTKYFQKFCIDKQNIDIYIININNKFINDLNKKINLINLTNIDEILNIEWQIDFLTITYFPSLSNLQNKNENEINTIINWYLTYIKNILSILENNGDVLIFFNSKYYIWIILFDMIKKMFKNYNMIYNDDTLYNCKILYNSIMLIIHFQNFKKSNYNNFINEINLLINGNKYQNVWEMNDNEFRDDKNNKIIEFNNILSNKYIKFLKKMLIFDFSKKHKNELLTKYLFKTISILNKYEIQIKPEFEQKNFIKDYYKNIIKYDDTIIYKFRHYKHDVLKHINYKNKGQAISAAITPSTNFFFFF